MRVLVTGAAGFIGSNVVRALFAGIDGVCVLGVDNMDPYYDCDLKRSRLDGLYKYDGFEFRLGDISDSGYVQELFEEFRPEYVLNFAAKVGVRHSVTSPEGYITTNINGFFNILEACRKYPVKHLVYASSSSVYGANVKVPYSVDDKVDAPLSLYAATKKSNELMAHSYSNLYGVPSTGLRFFTVYGPAGRPDMAYFSFTDKFVRGEKVQIYNYGCCRRDFTYVDDIAEGVLCVMQRPPKGEVPYALYNIGNSSPEHLMDFVRTLHEVLVEAGVLPGGHSLDGCLELLPMQPGDVKETCADMSAMENVFRFKPSTSLRDGLMAFAKWYRNYYSDKQI